MIYYEIPFGVCVVLLFVVRAALAAAQRNGDPRRAYVLHLIRIGLGLSAVSYLLRFLEAPPHGSHAFFSFLTGLSGTTFLWLGWREHSKLCAERRNPPAIPRGEEDEPAPALPSPSLAAGPSPLTARAREVLTRAQDEARKRQANCVETDHLLLGLLCEADSAGVCLLRVLGAIPEKVLVELLGQMAPGRSAKTAQEAKVGAPALTERADQVLTLAAQEAHRFGRTSVSTDCLLLGLVLVGKGKAAAVLFAAGLTADGIRSEILRSEKALGSR